MNAETLRAQRHDPPKGWPPEVFEKVTDALASALVAVVRRDVKDTLTVNPRPDHADSD